MKRVIALLLALMLLWSFGACGKESAEDEETEKTTEDTEKAPEGTEGTEPPEEKKTVTLYIPKTVQIKVEDGAEGVTSEVCEIFYEENWQEKDTFTTGYELEIADLTQKVTMTVSDEKTVQKQQIGEDNITTIEAYHDENGRAVKMVTYPAQGSLTEKIENITTYDAQGRIVKTEIKNYNTGSEAPVVTTQTYTYAETADGSRGVDDLGTTTMVYNKENQLVEQIIAYDGQEMSRTVYTYNAYGKQETIAQYVQGKLNSTITYTYEAVEVSPEKAAQLPQYQ
ncbi:MAG: hypothetical protein IKB09_12075 [Oscillospiraceae bacterium]|nr:hypothetical protein [Oscillospiraceae bacterium]